MYEELEKPRRELALEEPLRARAREMFNVPVEIETAKINAMPPACKNALTTPAATSIYVPDGSVFKLRDNASDLSDADKFTILGCLNVANGIRMLRVSVDNAADTAMLELHFFNMNHLQDLVDAVDADHSAGLSRFPISGGSRRRAGSAIGQVQVDTSPAPATSPAVLAAADNPVIVLRVKPIGDYSNYTLKVRPLLVAQKFDPLFSEISFKFRPGCFNTNCAPEWETGSPPLEEPKIDYQAKDYGSFRETMIAGMMSRVPGWQPTSEADLDMVLADTFSVVADELSDYQDRVMNEAFFTAARKRVSVARHSRLMDYHIHQGNQASTVLALEIEHHSGLPKSFELNDGLTVWAGESKQNGEMTDTDASVVFRSRHKQQTVHQYLNNIGLYTWENTITTLKAGSTSADLRLFNHLYQDDSAEVPVNTAGAVNEIRDLIRFGNIRYLLIQEHKNPATGFETDRDPLKRQLLRLKQGNDAATAEIDPITGVRYVRINWEKEDALRHDYCFTVDCPADNSATAEGTTENVSLFHGNLIEVFHGRLGETVFKKYADDLVIDPAIPLELLYKQTRWGTVCSLPEETLAYQNTPAGGDVAPFSTLDVQVELGLGGPVDDWNEVPSFIHSDDSAENGDHFVVETDENRRSVIRFGNGKNGMELPDNAVVNCVYQYGDPLAGNVGLDMIANFDPLSVTTSPAAPALNVRNCWNPFDVTNGKDREPIAEIVRRVPEAYRQRQLRAVTLADYIKRAEEVDGVSRAAARYAWTGSWRTVRITIDPVGTDELSDELRKRVESYLNALRMIGEDLEIRPPKFVPLEIKVVLCAEPDVWPEDVRFVLEQEFSDSWTPDGRMGFFHPDLWTFGQPLYASQIIGRAMKISGVEHVVAKKDPAAGSGPLINVSIKRWNSPTVPAESMPLVNYNEILQVRNDPDRMEDGTIAFKVKGGRQ